MRTSGLMGGTDPKTTFAMVITTGFWLLRPAKARAVVSPMLNSKLLGFKDLGFYVFRTLIYIVGKP